MIAHNGLKNNDFACFTQEPAAAGSFTPHIYLTNEQSCQKNLPYLAAKGLGPSPPSSFLI